MPGGSISQDYIGAGDFYTMDQPNFSILLTNAAMLHSTNGRIFLGTFDNPHLQIDANAIASSAGTSTIHYTTAATSGSVEVWGAVRNINADGAAVRIWGKTSVVSVDSSGAIIATGAHGVGISFAVDSPNSQSSVLNYGLITGYRAIERTGSESVTIFNVGTITGSGFAFIDSFGGADTITNYGTINGSISLGGGADKFLGRDGYVVGQIYGGSGNDVLQGGNRAVTIFGETGEDEITGGEGNDRLFGGDDNDKAWGGAGDDLLEGWSGDDLLYGEVGNDTFYGNTGDDKVYGGDGNDVLWGQENNDLLYGGAGADTMHGGTGNDRFYVDRTGDLVFEAIGGGVGQVITSSNYRLAAGVEVETLSTTGGTAALSLYGNEFSQKIYGNEGHNKLYGYAGDDTLSGVDGKDYLYGGTGNDRLVGGVGNDRFVFDTKLDRAANVDTIVDFSSVSGNADTILLDNAIFRKLSAEGVLNSAYFDANRTGAARDGNDYITYNTATGVLSYDADGSRDEYDAVGFAVLGNRADLAASDFLVV